MKEKVIDVILISLISLTVVSAGFYLFGTHPQAKNNSTETADDAEFADGTVTVEQEISESDIETEKLSLVHTINTVSPNVPECDYVALKAQAEEFFRATDFDRRLWTVAGVEEIPEPVDYYGSIVGSDYKFRPCAVAITYKTQADVIATSDLRESLIKELELEGWSSDDPQEFVSQNQDTPIKVLTPASDGSSGGRLVFVRRLSGFDAVQFAEVTDFEFRTNPMEFDEFGNVVNELCPCWKEVTLKLSAPVELWTEGDLVTSNQSVCRYDELQQQAEGIIELVGIDDDVWQLVSATATPSSEQYMFAMGEVGDIVPCSFKLTYTGPVTDNLPENFAPTLFDTLHSSSWHSDMYQTFISDSTGASTTVALAHAGGPLGDTTIFTNALYDERAVQFIRVSERRYFENFLEARDGLVDSPCPCRNEVSLEISAPVSFAGWLGE